MINNDDDDLKYKDIIESLKGLQKVNAPKNFETELQRKINSQIVEKKKPLWKNFFIPSRLVPSAALAISAVVLFFILTNNNDLEDPMLMEPKMREDFISTDDILVIYLPVSYSMGSQRSEEDAYSNITEVRDERNDSPFLEKDTNLYFSNNYYLINKKGLNFRQVNLSKEEQNQIKLLKEQFTKLLESNRNN